MDGGGQWVALRWWAGGSLVVGRLCLGGGRAGSQFLAVQQAAGGGWSGFCGGGGKGWARSKVLVGRKCSGWAVAREPRRPRFVLAVRRRPQGWWWSLGRWWPQGGADGVLGAEQSGGGHKGGAGRRELPTGARPTGAEGPAGAESRGRRGAGGRTDRSSRHTAPRLSA
ncbi:uncharacterized protein LOC131875880 [Cryptomeria japonica]|uniref:uncharacterized protein LOC131875880 n=1 Tax=Cryptomeria japonica TaxID=3369 RepID=UPI0027DA90C8|nr:uncharacterized protein LOC131875880 [Cryptomeria japonica]